MLSNQTAQTLPAALHAHLAWQRRLLERANAGLLTASDEESLRFLVLRPGDRNTLCSTGWLASGRCFPAAKNHGITPESMQPWEHWDDVVIAHPGIKIDQRMGSPKRLLPGLGNIACSIASAAVIAMLSKRVLQVENWTIAAGSFAPPLPELLAGSLGNQTSGWEPYIARAQAISRAETFITSDDVSLSGTLCAADLSREPAARVWRIFSNQYFIPPVLLNPHHQAQMGEWLRPSSGRRGRHAGTKHANDDEEDGGGGGGEVAMAPRSSTTEGDFGQMWSPLIRRLFRPRAHLQQRIDSFAKSVGLENAITMHLRCMETLSGFCGGSTIMKHAACARSRLTATGATTLYIATMHARDRTYLTKALNYSGVTVVHIDGKMAERVETGKAWQEDARIIDTWLLSMGAELLLSPASTMGYVAMALAGPRTRITMLRTCEPSPSREASYHMLKNTIAYRRPKGERGVGASCRVLGDQMVRPQPDGEAHAHVVDEAARRVRAFWNASVNVDKI